MAQKNAAAAVMTANSLGLHTIGLTGKNGGKGDVMCKEGRLKLIRPGESVTYEVTVSLYEKQYLCIKTTSAEGILGRSGFIWFYVNSWGRAKIESFPDRVKACAPTQC